jgi:hypothetical protein
VAGGRVVYCVRIEQQIVCNFKRGEDIGCASTLYLRDPLAGRGYRVAIGFDEERRSCRPKPKHHMIKGTDSKIILLDEIEQMSNEAI